MEEFKPNFIEFLKWRLMLKRSERNRGVWPKWVDIEPSVPSPVPAHDLEVTYVNHSTFLIRLGGLNILTDPIWSERASPISFAGPRRVHAPGIRFEDLPKIDVVLISHDHYDHCDVPTLQRLEKTFQPLVVAGKGSEVFLKSKGMSRVAELAWWESQLLGGAVFHFVPAKHWSGRTLIKNNKRLWGSFVIAANHKTVYFAGDTGWDGHFDDIRSKFPQIDLALLPIGSCEPRWFMKRNHMNPTDAVAAHRALGAVQSIGMHYRTFRLSEESPDQPPRWLAEACADQGVDGNAFVTLEPGETWC